MATRRIYIALSRRLDGRHGLLGRLLLIVAVPGFAIVGVTSYLSGRPDIVVRYGGPLWFSATVALGVLWLITGLFNPQRDPLNGSLQESWAVFVLNAMLLVAVAAWFIE